MTFSTRVNRVSQFSVLHFVQREWQWVINLDLNTIFGVCRNMKEEIKRYITVVLKITLTYCALTFAPGSAGWLQYRALPSPVSSLSHCLSCHRYDTVFTHVASNHEGTMTFWLSSPSISFFLKVTWLKSLSEPVPLPSPRPHKTDCVNWFPAPTHTCTATQKS